MLSQCAVNYGRHYEPDYTETSCSERIVTVGKWLHQTKGSTKQFQDFKNPGHGAASLYETSMRTLLTNAHNLRKETLVDVPWEFARRIWKCIGEA